MSPSAGFADHCRLAITASMLMMVSLLTIVVFKIIKFKTMITQSDKCDTKNNYGDNNCYEEYADDDDDQYDYDQDDDGARYNLFSH